MSRSDAVAIRITETEKPVSAYDGEFRPPWPTDGRGRGFWSVGQAAHKNPKVLHSWLPSHAQP
jgi:hypothetical protein